MASGISYSYLQICPRASKSTRAYALEPKAAILQCSRTERQPTHLWFHWKSQGQGQNLHHARQRWHQAAAKWHHWGIPAQPSDSLWVKELQKTKTTFSLSLQALQLFISVFVCNISTSLSLSLWLQGRFTAWVIATWSDCEDISLSLCTAPRAVSCPPWLTPFQCTLPTQFWFYFQAQPCSYFYESAHSDKRKI